MVCGLMIYMKMDVLIRDLWLRSGLYVFIRVWEAKILNQFDLEVDLNKEIVNKIIKNGIK